MGEAIRRGFSMSAEETNVEGQGVQRLAAWRIAVKSYTTQVNHPLAAMGVGDSGSDDFRSGS